jgi:hypothetical protein
MSGSKHRTEADRTERPAANGQTGPAEDNQASHQDASGTLGLDDLTEPDGAAASGDAAPAPVAEAPQSSVADATEAGIIAVKAVWGQATTLIPLLAVASYGLGRLMVDGFYAQLHTTAEAAGLGYSSILEPAAILTAFGVVIGTVIVMLQDAFQVILVRLFRQREKILLPLSLVGLVGGVALFAEIARAADVIIDAFVSGVALPAFRALVDRFGSARNRRIGATRIRVDRSLMGEPSARPPIAKKAISVVLSLAFLASIFFGAHELGYREGRKAASGKFVDINVFGFNVPSITATAVRVQPIASSSVLEQLTTDGCLLEIGSDPTIVLLYDPADKTTLAVPADQVVVVDSNKSCPK